jgi:DNA polymerase V
VEPLVEVSSKFISNIPTDLPLYICRVQAGFPSPADDYLDKGLDLNEFLIKKPTATILMRVGGDSMSGAGIDEGDILVVDKSLTARHDSIVVAIVDGDFTVKRLHIRGGAYFLKAENIKYPIIDVSKCQDFEVSGVVTYVIKSCPK